MLFHKNLVGGSEKVFLFKTQEKLSPYRFYELFCSIILACQFE